jgi:phosphoglycolate phosphatase
MPPDILFDLDGTLIDSSPGILASFARVLAAQGLAPAVPLEASLIDSSPGIIASFARVLSAHGLPPAVPLEASLIGPPLAVTLRQVSGVDDETLLVRLVEAFKADYDTEGYRTTHAFDGVAEGLVQLATAGARLFIVTNKRMVPTRRILEALGLADCFAGIHTRDETDPPAPSKAAVARRIIAHYAIDPARALFVGDSDEDAAAARENGLRFIHATYGYGAAGIASRPDAVLQDFAHLPGLVDVFLHEGLALPARP